MATKVKTGWLYNKNGDKFAPKTLTSQVQTSDGVLLENKIQKDLDAAKTEILANVTVTVDNSLSSTSENPVQNKVINAEFETVVTAMNALETSIDGKADASHSHDDLYYTETEIDTKVTEINTSIENMINGATTVAKATKATSADSATTAASATKATQDGNNNVIASTYETKTDAATKLGEAKSYTDSKTANLASTTVVDNKISTHNTSTSAHSDIRVLITDLTTKLNNFLDVDDTTTDQLSEIITLINNNKGTLESLTTSKVNVSDIVDNLTTASTSKVLSANQGVVIKNLINTLQNELDSHTHIVSDITDLTATATELNYMDGVTANVQTQLDGKQNVLSGTSSQIVGFNSEGNAVAQDTYVTATSTDGATYTATVLNMDSLVVGKEITIIPDTTSTTTSAKLNVNNLGAKTIRMPIAYNTSLTAAGPIAGWLVANKPITVQWNGTYWVTTGFSRPAAQYLYGTVPVENGGTGATTATDALTNLGAAPAYVYGTEDLTAGTSPLETGKLYFVYE